MADQKISALTALTSLTDDDLLVAVDDPAGTPATKKITAANVRNSIVGGAALNFPAAGTASYKRGFLNDAVGGTVDLYTCPSGKRAIIGEIDIYNPTAGSINATPKIKIGSTYYLLSALSAVSAGARLFGTAGGFGAPIVLEANNKLAMVTSATGLNISWFCIEIPDTSNMKMVATLGLANGKNTVYTCPVGKVAYVYNGIGFGLPLRLSRLLVSNESGASRNYIAYFVPSGGTAGSTNQTSPSTAIADVSAGTFNVDSFLEAQDSLVVETNNGAAGQNVFLTVCEF